MQQQGRMFSLIVLLTYMVGLLIHLRNLGCKANCQCYQGRALIQEDSGPRVPSHINTSGKYACYL